MPLKDLINTIICGDCLEVMRDWPDNCVDLVLTDPPYGIGFMGKEWDTFSKDYLEEKRETDKVRSPRTDGRKVAAWGNAGDAGSYDQSHSGHIKFQKWYQAIMKECLRVLKPGGHLLSFGGSRTYHRMACAVEDAGFEIRDQIMWVYGSGFPKSLNIGKKVQGWDGYGTALKPAHEPIVMARKPISEKTIAKNVLKWGTGSLNIDGCRVEHANQADMQESMNKNQHQNYKNPHSNKDSYSGDYPERTNYDGSQGRWPANFIHDGSNEVVGLMPETKSGKVKHSKQKYAGDSKTGFLRGVSNQLNQHGDSGSAARFFYCAKASKAERNMGCEGLPKGNPPASARSKPAEGRNAPLGEPRQNHHPTVKPLKLMQYLVRLANPPDGIVLDPFVGSGTTAMACVKEGFKYVGIEKDAEYCEIARKRIEAADKGITVKKLEKGQGVLFER